MEQPGADVVQTLERDGIEVRKGSISAGQGRVEIVNQDVYQRWRDRWCRHAAQNLPTLAGNPGIRMLTMSAKGLPTVVVGIGPSLDRSAELLKPLVDERRAVVISTDAALRPLIARGVRPHLVVNFDCREEQGVLFDGVDTRDLTLVVNASAHPKTLAAWKGPRLAYTMEHVGLELCDVFLPALYPDLGSLPNAGTVGNGAAILAWIMGCTEILTLGMDLCYREISGGYRYRCSDFSRTEPDPTLGLPGGWTERASSDSALYNNQERLKDTYDVELGGTTYKVDPELDLYRDILVRNVGRWDLPVTDLSGGALTPFVRALTPEEGFKRFCAKPIQPGESVVFHLSKILGTRP